MSRLNSKAGKETLIDCREEDESERIRSNIFKKSEEKTSYLLKSKLNYD